MKQSMGKPLAQQLTRSLWAAILVLDLFVGVGAWLTLDVSRQNYETRATTTAVNAANMLDQAISIYVRQIDLASLHITDQLEDQLRRTGRISELTTNRFLARQSSRLVGDSGVRVCDAEGRVFLGGDVSPASKVSWRDRDFFQFLSRQNDHPLFVSDPIVGRVTKTGQVAFIRRYNRADGSFAGLVSISISLKTFSALLSVPDLGHHGVALLRDSQRRMIARNPPIDAPEGQTGAQGYSKELGKIMDAARKSDTYHADRTSDGVERINAYLRLTSVPFHLVTGVASQDYLSPWRTEVRNTSIAVAAYVAITGLLGWLLRNSLRLVSRVAEQNRLLLLGASDGISILDQRGHILEASESFCEALGYSREEIIGKPIHSLDASMSSEEVSRTIEHVFHEGQVLRFESAHRHKAGMTIPVEVTAKRLMVSGQHVIFTSTRNISERLRVESQLRESEKRFRQLIEKNHSVMLEIHPESGQILAANESAATYYGYPLDTLMQMSIAQINVAPPQEVADEMRHVVQEERGYFNFHHRLASGEIREVEVYSTPVEIHGQQHLFSIVHDISIRRQAELSVKLLMEEQRAILNSDIVGISKVRDRRMLWVNDAYAKMFGYSREELTGQTTDMLYPDADAKDSFAAAAYPVVNAGEVFKTQVQYKRKDGSLGWCNMTGALVSPVSMVSVWAFTDVTEIIAADSSRRLAASVFSNSYDGIVITDVQNHIVDVNPAFSRITGFSRDEVLGKNPKQITSGRQDEGFYQAMWSNLQQSGSWHGEIWNRRKTGEIYAEMLSISAVRDQRGEVQNYIGVFSDISSLKLHEQELDKIAHFDALTGLPNRRLFQNQLQRAIQLAHRTECDVALLVIDLDRFKEVNDTLGHDAGDQLLQDAAKRLQLCVRESDSIARLGGDEFVVVMPGVKGQAAVTRVAQSIVDAMQTTFWLQGQEACISASVGVAIFPDDAKDAISLFKHADQAMYEAKELGRNRFEFFKKSMQTIALNRVAIGLALRHAFDAEQFELLYQPILELDGGRIVKCEALIRWQHPERGLIGPTEFISIAEDIGLIGQIGEWVFRQATSDIARINAAKGSHDQAPICVGVNVSPKQFHYGLELQHWLAHLEKIGLPPELLVVEVTEGLLLESRPEVAAQLLTLRDAGIQVAIDDFGTGYSALSYLTKFHIDFLKIDQSFISRIESSMEDLAIVEAIVSMAHKLGIKVIAEGIETPAQRALLMSAECDLGQGFHFAKPMCFEDFRTLVLGSAV